MIVPLSIQAEFSDFPVGQDQSGLGLYQAVAHDHDISQLTFQAPKFATSDTVAFTKCTQRKRGASSSNLHV